MTSSGNGSRCAPLLVAAVTLALATLGGAALVERGEPGAALALVALAAALALVVRHVAPRASCVPAWLLVATALAAARPIVLARQTRVATPADAELGLDAETVVGRWRPVAHGSALGRIDRVGGEAGRVPMLYELEPRAPLPAGTWIAVLPGEPAIPAPRGPVARPGSRGEATRIVAPDERLVHLAPSRFAGLRDVLRGWRERALERARLLDRGGSGLVQALLLGDRGAVDAGTLDLFTRTGTRHLLALSGLHVGLFASFVVVPATALLFLRRGRPGRRRRATACVRLLIIGAYVVLVGAGDPIVRAGLALAFVWIGPLLRRPGARVWESGRRADPFAVLGFALLVEVLLDPRGLSNLSLQLSYVATLGILVGTVPLRDACLRACAALRSGPDVAALALHDAGRIGRARFALRIVAQRCGRFFVTGVATSAAAVLATLPLTAYHFGELSAIGMLVTPLVGPIVALVLLFGAIGLALGSDAGVSAHLIDAMLAMLRATDALPGTPLPLPPRPVWFLAALALASFACLRATGLARGRRMLVRSTALAGAIALVPWTAAPSRFELVALDVGHGTSCALRAPGLPALVFDAGSRDRRRLYSDAIGPLLASWDVARPWVLLSHPDDDHASALGRLVERYPPAVWLGALPEHLAERLAHDTLVADPRVGRIEIDAPALGLALVRGAATTGNEGSRSLEVSWRGERILLTGDAEAEGLERCLAEGWVRRPLVCLLFPHHGSETALASDLIGLLGPDGELWVSAAGPPALAPEFERRGIPWRQTATDGALALDLP